MTYLELVNKVLERLRQSPVSTVSENEYSSLIGLMVNEAKDQVENSWNWSVLRHTVTVSAVNNTSTYDLTGTKDSTRILDAYNTTSKIPLLPESKQYINYRLNTNNTTGTPRYFNVQGVSSSGLLQVRLFQTPNGNFTVTFNCVTNQNELTDDSDILLIPYRPVLQYAYLRAINERGEDQGRLSDTQEMLARQTWADAVSIDANNYIDELTWQAT